MRTDQVEGLVTVQQCRKLDGWQVVSVASSSGDGAYVVHANPWGEIDAYVCECKGYQHRGQCRHQVEAYRHLCDWSEVRDGRYTELMQTDEQKLHSICPQCGGPTMWVMELLLNGEQDKRDERWLRLKQRRKGSTR